VVVWFRMMVRAAGVINKVDLSGMIPDDGACWSECQGGFEWYDSH